MKRRAVALIAVAIVLAFVTDAFARPGGGESFSGGGGHGGGGGGGSGGDGGAIFELIYWLLRLIIEVPQLGLPVLGIVIGWVVYSAYKQHKNKDWDSGPPVQLARAISMEPLRRVDPDFSQVLFEDFAFRLFSTAHRARHAPDQLALVSPYVSVAARMSLLHRHPGQQVKSVVVGALRTFRVEVPPPTGTPEPTRVRIGVEYEANVTTAQHTYYTVERWVFGRDANVRSKPPGATKTFPCPNCGAPWRSLDTGTQKCASCGEIVDNGRFDWVVEDIHLASSHERAPTLTTDTEERGTDLDTYRQHDIDAHWKELETDDPALTEDNLTARVVMIFHALNKAWSSNELRPVRGFVSDGLYDYLSYWVEEYKRQKLRNQLDDTILSHALVAKVVRDRWYDAVTIRIWGAGKDYIVDARGRVVRGSRHRTRGYSEYWTLIRSRSRKGAPLANPVCGNCGAPLQITMAGECEHCNAHITAGEFDWVLSKIEQDDTYRG